VTRTLVILDAYDPSGPSVRTLYLTNATPFITGPSETPSSQSFAPVLAQPLDVRRRLQGIGATRPTLGEIRVNNQDGTYDAWLGYAFDGRAITVRTGPESGAYPAAYPVAFTGQIDRCDVQGDQIVLRVRDLQAALDTPLQTTRFAGDNIAPDGLEGEDDLEGQPKPRIYGRVYNAPMIPVNDAKLIYQVSDTAAQGVQSVRDGSVLLGVYTPVDWGNLTTVSAFALTAVETPSLVAGDALMFGGQVDLGGASFRAGVARTTDGSAWATPTTPFASGAAGRYVTGLAYSVSLDVVVAVTNLGEVATSTDQGATWTIRTAAAAATYQNVRRDESRGLFLAVGNTGVIHTSPTGTTWTAQTSGTTDTLYDVATGGPTLVAVGAGGRIVRSDDGLTWATFTAGAVERRRCLWDGVAFLAPRTGTSDTLMLDRSADGSGWVESALPSPTSAATTTDILFENGWYLIGRVSSIGEYAIFVSRDGIQFTEYKDTTFTLAGGPSGIAAYRDRFYTIGNTNAIVRSGAPTTYATLADLEDDALAPTPGSYKWIGDAAGTYIRLGSRPFFEVRADATQGATAANRTAAQLMQAALLHAGYTSAIWNAGDMTALDTADNSELGLVLTGDETVAEAIDALATSVGAWWGIDANGVLRVQQLTAPSGSSTFTITDNDIIGRLERLASADPLLGLPSYRTTLRYARTDTLALDGAVLDTDVAVQTAHLLAGSTEEDTLYTNAADAQAEADRRQTLRGVQRSAFRVVVPMHDTDRNYEAIALGAVGTLQHPRFGLSGGVLVRVIGIEPNAAQRQLTLTLWF
jgi:hypothetical protein